MSFDLTPYDLASAIDAVDKLLVEQAKEADQGQASQDFNVESLNSGSIWDGSSSVHIVGTTFLF